MYEYETCRELIKSVEEKAKEQNISSVAKIEIVAGVACGIDKNILINIFKEHFLSSGIACGAEIEVIEEPLKAKCNNCNNDIDVNNMQTMFCPKCGSGGILILSGNDCFVKNIR